MELCDGDLNTYVEEWKNTGSPDIDIMVLGQIVVALQHLRGLDIVHKDLKPIIHRIPLQHAGTAIPTLQVEAAPGRGNIYGFTTYNRRIPSSRCQNGKF